jgi:hypothetical protein
MPWAEAAVGAEARGVGVMDALEAALLAAGAVVAAGLLLRGAGGSGGGIGRAVGAAAGGALGGAVGGVVGGAAQAAVQHPVGTAAVAAAGYALGRRSRPPSGGAGGSALARRARAAARRVRQAASSGLRAARSDALQVVAALRGGALTRPEAVALLGAGGLAALLAVAPEAVPLLAA